ncbi:MAG: hypothetical protein JWP00_1294 [Chloroflexi bacterium]|nr:hypothetical protein [Chloroflexota bacterium]
MKHILFTNNTLDNLAGSELYIYDLAREYKRRGLQVTCFTLKPGKISERLEKVGIRTTGDLSSVTDVDLIHAHHRLEFKLAAAYFPQVPLVHASLGPNHPYERPTGGKAIITCNIAISQLIKRILIEHEGICPGKIEVVPNFVNLERFSATRRIEKKPKRVLLLSNYFKEEEAVRKACEAAGGLELTWIGAASTPVWEVEKYIEQADIIVGKGQSALQAMAMGRAVVVFGPIYSDGLVTAENFEAMAACNFNGMSAMLEQDVPPQKMGVVELAAEFNKFDRDSAEALRDRVRAEFNVGRVAGKLLAIYEQAAVRFKTEWQEQPRARAEVVARELGEYLAFLKDADANRENIAPLKEGYVKLNETYIELLEIHNRNISEVARLENQLTYMADLLERIAAGRVMKSLNYFNKTLEKLKQLKR